MNTIIINKKAFRFATFAIAISILISYALPIYVSATNFLTNNNIEYEIPQNAKFSEDTVLVALKNQTSLQFNKYNADDFKDIGCSSVKDLSILSGTKIEQAINNIARNITEGKDIESYNGINFSKYNQVLSLKLNKPGKENVLKAIEILKKRDDVLFAEPNYLFEADFSIPTDPSYSIWQTSIVNSLNLQAAWNITTGSSSVMIGIIDSGIDIDNNDLADNVDEAKSRNFYDNSNPCVDNSGHGTFIAGLIGAKWNNEYLIAGVCEHVSLVSLKVTSYNAEDGKYYADVEATKLAIEYAQDRNIPILNFSYGNYSLSDVLENAISSYDGLFIASSGNDGKDTDMYHHTPSGLNKNNIISVGACYETGTACDFSNYGKVTVDIFAPGAQMKSTYPLNLNSNGTHIGSGTSYAAPYVAGVAALMLSINPDLSATQLKSLILRNATTIPNLSDKCSSKGMLNAYKAVNSVYMENEIEYGHNNSPTEHKVYLDICSECDCREPDGSCNNCGICDPCTNCHTILYSQLHNYATINSNNSMHTLYCLDCNYLLTSVHDWAYVATPTTHTAICRDCGFTQTSSNHSYIYTTDSIYHYGTCFSCGYEYQEYHNWTIENSEYRCTICMLAYTGIPPVIQSVPPIEDNHSE